MTSKRKRQSPVMSYRVCAGSNVYSDDQSTVPAGLPAGATSLERVPLNGMFYGCSKTRMAEVLDGTSNTILMSERLRNPSGEGGQNPPAPGLIKGNEGSYRSLRPQRWPFPRGLRSP